MSSNRVSQIHVYGSADLALAFANWPQLTNVLLLTNGTLRMDGLTVSGSGMQFFRAVETP
ncbi:MAG: hypothetical protein ACYDH9_08425 [Limisphaerales bacterium]